MRRVAEFDALRGIAVTVVLLFHLDPLRYFPGWTGVDLFFVLSGYLITAIILANDSAATDPGPGYQRFYVRFFARRALRIWPIYYLVLVTLILIDRTLAWPPESGWVAYATLFAQNTSLYVKVQPPPPHPAFDHAWTLALEEQFYLVWPILVLGARRMNRFVPLCVLVIAVNLALRSRENGFLPNNYGERLLVTRSDGFALGALLANALRPGGWAAVRPDRGRWVFGGLIAAAAVYLHWGIQTYGALGFIGLPTPVWPAETIFGFAVLYAGLIGTVATHSGAGWLAPLRFPPLVYLGRISYGLYLYHYGVYWALDGFGVPPGKPAMEYAQPLAEQATKLTVSLAAAVASWHLIERPILRLKDRLAYRRGAPPPASAGDSRRRDNR